MRSWDIEIFVVSSLVQIHLFSMTVYVGVPLAKRKFWKFYTYIVCWLWMFDRKGAHQDLRVSVESRSLQPPHTSRRVPRLENPVNSPLLSEWCNAIPQLVQLLERLLVEFERCSLKTQKPRNWHGFWRQIPTLKNHKNYLYSKIHIRLCINSSVYRIEPVGPRMVPETTSNLFILRLSLFCISVIMELGPIELVNLGEFFFSIKSPPIITVVPVILSLFFPPSRRRPWYPLFLCVLFFFLFF